MALDYTFNLYSHRLSAKSEIFISLLYYHPDNIVNCDQVHTIIIIHHFAQFSFSRLETNWSDELHNIANDQKLVYSNPNPTLK